MLVHNICNSIFKIFKTTYFLQIVAYKKLVVKYMHIRLLITLQTFLKLVNIVHQLPFSGIFSRKFRLLLHWKAFFGKILFAVCYCFYKIILINKTSPAIDLTRLFIANYRLILNMQYISRKPVICYYRLSS